ncbi:hypothetical protein DIPPA_13256 [Diplonema papillatum]|nr:hypothetical protein DIPPA_13256 [Diplonema papillatum]
MTQCATCKTIAECCRNGHLTMACRRVHCSGSRPCEVEGPNCAAFGRGTTGRPWRAEKTAKKKKKKKKAESPVSAPKVAKRENATRSSGRRWDRKAGYLIATESEGREDGANASEEAAIGLRGGAGIKRRKGRIEAQAKQPSGQTTPQKATRSSP